MFTTDDLPATMRPTGVHACGNPACTLNAVKPVATPLAPTA